MFAERVGADAKTDVDSALVSTAGGPHAELAGRAAGAVARSEDATCRIVHVVDPNASESDREEAQELLDKTAKAVDVSSVETELLGGTNVTERLLEETEDHDVTVVGATRESRVRQLVFGAVPETIGRKARNMTIMARRQTGAMERLVGRVRQWVGAD